MILVVGAGGNVASLLVERLASEGIPLAATVRPGGARSPLPAGVRVIEADLERPGALGPALSGVDAVVWTPAVKLLPRSLADLVKSGARVVAVSSASVHTRLPSAGAQAKRDAEAELERSGLAYTLIRPTMIYGNRRDRNLSRLLDWLDRSPVYPLVGGRALMQPVYIRDVVDALARALRRPLAAGRAYDLGGAAPLCYRELVLAAGRALGIRPILVPIPLALSAVGVRWASRLGLKSLREEQVWRLGEDKVVDNGPVRRDLGVEPLAFPEGIARQVAERRSAGAPVGGWAQQAGAQA